MTELRRPVNIHLNYHAHLYFDCDTVDFATSLSQKIGELFELKVGRVHQKAVGPHPKWSCQITFSNKEFTAFIPWLDENRNGLTVLIHGVTGDDLKDHTEHVYWLGDSAELNLAMFGG